MRSWLLELPQTQPMSLNDRQHWRVKADKTAEYVDATILLCRQQKIPRLGRVGVLLAYGPRDRRVRDPLNLVQTLKAVEDGIVRAGIVPDDNPRYMESPMPVILAPRGLTNANGGRLWAVVEELADTPG